MSDTERQRMLDDLCAPFPRHAVKQREGGGIFGVPARKMVQLPQRNRMALAVIGPTPGRDMMEEPTMLNQHTPTPLNEQAPTTKRAWKRWTEREDELLRACVPAINTERLAFILDRSPKSVLHRVHSLGMRYLEHPARFWAEVNKTADCWEWIGGKQSSGYGYYALDGKMRQAHRVAYEMAHGPIPADHQIHHRCHNRPCVNPAHLEPIHKTKHVLIHDTFSGRKSRQTHCIRGHEFTPENTYRWHGMRKCRTCMRAHKASRRAA